MVHVIVEAMVEQILRLFPAEYVRGRGAFNIEMLTSMLKSVRQTQTGLELGPDREVEAAMSAVGRRPRIGMTLSWDTLARSGASPKSRYI
jgi:hypothetical protein